MTTKVAILGTGNVGTDMLFNIKHQSKLLKVGLFAGVEKSDSIYLAQEMGVETSTEGIGAVLADPSIQMVFDATNAHAQMKNAPLLKMAGIITVDLTPAAIESFVVPALGIDSKILDQNNIGIGTCGGQSTIPIVYAVSQVAEIDYVETVTTIPSKSAGPGMRADIDEFNITTSRGLEVMGRAKKAKSIVILNQADPPIIYQNTLYIVLEKKPDGKIVTASIEAMVRIVQQYIPGYRLKFQPMYDDNKVTVVLKVEGMGGDHRQWAGSLDIMTSSALTVGEAIALKMT